MTDKKTQKIKYLSDRLIFLHDQLDAAKEKAFADSWISYLKSQIKTVVTNRDKLKKTDSG